MRRTNVRSYEKRDGTKVSSHERSLNGDAPNVNAESYKPPKESSSPYFVVELYNALGEKSSVHSFDAQGSAIQFARERSDLYDAYVYQVGPKMTQRIKSFLRVEKKLVAPFDKEVLTESEIRKLTRMLNEGKIDFRHLNKIDRYATAEGWKVTDAQFNKAITWLKDKWKSPTGKERLNNPFKYREENAIEKAVEIRLKSWYDSSGRYNAGVYVPTWEVVPSEGETFEYANIGGRVEITG